MHTFASKPEATQQTGFAKSTMPGRSHFGQRPEVRSNLDLYHANGNKGVQQTDAGQPEAQLTEPTSHGFGHDFSQIPIYSPAAGAIQTKLAINEPGDVYEQEADHVAEQVVRTPEPQFQSACPCGGGCPTCRTEQPGWKHERLLTKRVQPSDTGQNSAPPIVHKVLASPGQPLDPATRAFMEPRFGRDFSQVRVHSGEAAEQSAREVNATAYAVGHDIVFGAGHFAPGTHAGRRLIAHELAHVVQQSGGNVHVMNPPISEVSVSRGELPARADGIPALQRAAGNHVVNRVLQRTPIPGRPATPELKVRERVDAFRRGMTRAQELRQIADRLIEKELGSAPSRSLRARSNGLAEVVRRGGPQAEVARRLGVAVAEIEATLERSATDVRSVVDDLIERRLGARPKTPVARENALRTLVGQGGEIGQQAIDVERQLREVEQELIDRKPRPAKFADPSAPKIDKTVAKETPKKTSLDSQKKVEAPPATAPNSGQVVNKISRFKSVGRFLAREVPGLIGQAVVMLLFPPGVRVHNDKADELSRKKIEPAVQAALAQQESVFNKLVDNDLSKSIYANVKVRLVYAANADSSGNLHLFLDDSAFLEMKITNDYIDLRDRKFDATGRRPTKEITYSFLVYEPESVIREREAAKAAQKADQEYAEWVRAQPNYKEWVRAQQEYEECVKRYGTGRIPPAAGADEVSEGHPDSGPCIVPHMKPMEGP